MCEESGEEGPGILLEGWLEKRSPAWHRRWQRRWFRLDAQSILYFKAHKSPGTLPRGMIPLLAIEEVSCGSTPRVIKLKTSLEDKRGDTTFVLRVANEKEARQWLGAIGRAACLSAEMAGQAPPRVVPMEG